MSSLKINETLLDGVIRGTTAGLEMTEISPEPVGASRFFSASRDVSIIVSLIGERNGTMTLNLSRTGAAFLAGRLLGEDQSELTDDALDGICEIGNMIAGNIKAVLHDTEFTFSAISCPALIMGANYNLYHYRGIITASVEFEIEEIPMVKIDDRFFSASISLMKN